MTTVNINVAVNSSNAQSRLKSLHKSVNRVGKSTKNAAKDFKELNQAMFAGTAFVGLFTQAFQGLADTLMQGSQFDRAMIQFSNRFSKELPNSVKQFSNGMEVTLGANGKFIQMIRGMTDNSIDMMEAMRSAIQLRSSGVTGDIKTLSEIVVRAGTAAKIAGKDSAEGIKRVTDFLKDGSLAHLQHLGLLRSVSPELRAQLNILNQSAGVLGTAVTGTYKLALGMKILREATKGQLKGQRDLRDTLLDTAQYFTHLKDTVGIFIGKAIQPLLEKFIDFSVNASFILEDIKNNKKEILFLAKAFIVGTSAVAGFVLVLGTLKLAMVALTSLVSGFPLFTGLMVAFGSAAIISTGSLKSFIEKLHTFGQVAKGAFDLAYSFLSSPENFAKGVGFMDAELHKTLKDKKLLTLATNIAKVGAVITEFIKGSVKGFIEGLTSMLNVLGPIGDGIKNFLNLNPEQWKRNWLTAAKEIGNAFGKMAASSLAFYAVMKLIRGGGAFKTMVGSGLLNKGFQAGKKGVGFAQKAVSTTRSGVQSSFLEIMTNPKGKLAGVFQVFKNLGTVVGKSLKILGKFGVIGAVVSVVATSLAGLAQGLFETRKGISKFVNAMTNWVKDIFETNPILKALKNGLNWVVNGIMSIFKKIYSISKELGNAFGNWLGEVGQAKHDELYDKRMKAARQITGTSLFEGTAMPSNQAQAVANVQATMRTLDKDKADNLKKVLTEAMSANSPDGLTISREEWENIIAVALDKSKNLGQMAESNKNVDNKTQSAAIKSGRAGVC